MNELKINKYKDFILSFFAGMNVGQGLFLRTISFKAEKDYVRNRSEMNNLYVVLNLLLSNDYLHFSNSSQDFIMLSQKGYDHINGDFPLELSISLGDLMYLREIEQKGKDFIFNELWRFIGKEEEAFFYVNDPDYYNTIKPFIQGAYPSYSEYIEYRKKEGVSTSRVVWYRELFSLLSDEDVKIFISKLSEKINISINNKRSDVCVETTLFDNVEKISKPQEEKGELRVIPMIVFISYAWDENKEEVQRMGCAICCSTCFSAFGFLAVSLRYSSAWYRSIAFFRASAFSSSVSSIVWFTTTWQLMDLPTSMLSSS